MAGDSTRYIAWPSSSVAVSNVGSQTAVTKVSGVGRGYPGLGGDIRGWEGISGVVRGYPGLGGAAEKRQGVIEKTSVVKCKYATKIEFGSNGSYIFIMIIFVTRINRMIMVTVVSG